MDRYQYEPTPSQMSVYCLVKLVECKIWAGQLPSVTRMASRRAHAPFRLLQTCSQVPDVQHNLNGYTLANGLFGVWNSLGTVLFAYGGHNVVLEIQVRLPGLLFSFCLICLPTP